MPGIGSQNYGSEPPVASHDEPVATNHLDGLQWGKSGLEMDEERKQQVFQLFYIIMIGFVGITTLISLQIIRFRSINRLLTSIFAVLKKHECGFRSALMRSFLPLEMVFLKILYIMEFI